MKITPFRLVPLLQVAVLSGHLAVSSLVAQQPPPLREPVVQDNEPDEEPLSLSPFQVSSAKDFGYRATNSITATGIGTRIYETPIAVSVVTRDLIEDINAVTLRESLQFTPGITTDSRDAHANVSRGFVAPTQVNRIGTFVRNASTEFVERVEIVKGPNSVFFGRVAPGGLINIITLKPSFATRTTLRATYGGYNSATVLADHDQRLNDAMALRVAGAWHERTGGYIDWTRDDYSAGYVAFAWKITPKISLNLNADYKEGSDNSSHSSPRSNADYIARGNPAQTAAQFVAANHPPGTPIYDVYAYDIASNRGRRLNNNGPEAEKTDRRANVMGDLLAEVAPWWTLRLAGAYTSGRETTMEISGFPDLGGLYRNQRGVYNGGRPRSQVMEAENVLSFDLGPTRHRLVAGGRYGVTRNQTFSISSNVTNHNHFTDGPRLLRSAFPTLQPTTYVLSEGKEQAVYVIDQISLFEDRLKVLAGVRNTQVKQVAVSAGQANLTAKETTPQVGLFYEVTKGLALFANYSRTFEPQFSVDVFGQIAPNVEGEGSEAGFKLDWGEGRWSGTASIFQIERSGEVRRDFLREIAEGRTPIFIPGGTSRSEGAELELNFTPTRNYQAVLGYAFLWDAKIVQDTTTPQFVGQRLPFAPRHQLTFWNRYTFVQAPLKGFFLGGGVRYATRMNSINNVQFQLFQSGYTVVDAVVGYETTLSNIPTKLQLNVKNLLDKEYADGRWNMPADPLTAYLTVEVQF